MSLIGSIRRQTPSPRRYLLGIASGVVQHLGTLISFIAIYLGFLWVSDLTPARAWMLAGVLAIGFLVSFLFGWGYNVGSAGESFKAYCAYRIKIARSLKTAPMGFLSEESLAGLLFGVTTTVDQVESFSTMLIQSYIQAYASGFFVLLGIFGTNQKLGVIALVLLIVVVAASRLVYKMGAVEMPRLYACETQLSAAFTNSLRGMSVLRTFPAHGGRAVERIHGAFSSAADALKEQQVRAETRYSLHEKLYTLLTLVASSVVAVCAAWLSAMGEIALPSALTLAAVGPMLFAGMQALTITAMLTARVPAAMRNLDRLAAIPAIADGARASAPRDADITFDHVTFGYDAARPVLKDISFKIPAGSKTAIVGPSGSGKTTIVNLIARFWDPQAGRIGLGDAGIEDYQTDTLLSQLSLVFQDVYLFDETVMDNIRIARPGATDEEVVEAARRARCEEFIQALPEGFQTRVGEGGSRLSGGERQRISIARALLKDAPIILLDEATSSVDPENEHEILKALDELTEGKTVISIAHRLSTVTSADQILVIADGQLAQQGTHEQLAAVPGIYADFLAARTRAATWTLV